MLGQGEPLQGGVASLLVGCKPGGFRTVANAAALFVQLFKERQQIQGQREQQWYPEERRVTVPESTIK